MDQPIDYFEFASVVKNSNWKVKTPEKDNKKATERMNNTTRESVITGCSNSQCGNIVH
jgi:hypothetical protein